MKKGLRKAAAGMVLAALCLWCGPMAASAMVRTPIASGTASYGNTKVTVDASNASQGYVMVKYKGSNNKIKECQRFL